MGDPEFDGASLERLRRRSSSKWTRFDPDVLPSGNLGLGLAHVRRRLQVRYGEDGGLLVFSRDGIYRVELRFPCESPIASSSRA